MLRRTAIAFAALACGACSITGPVLVIGDNGQIFRGSYTASLAGGSFAVTNGVVSCSGNYDALDKSPIITIPIKCSDGRFGTIEAIRDPDGRSGSGTARLNDGARGIFVFGAYASDTAAERTQKYLAGMKAANDACERQSWVRLYDKMECYRENQLAVWRRYYSDDVDVFERLGEMRSAAAAEWDARKISTDEFKAKSPTRNSC